jgi:hypothetical protein
MRHTLLFLSLALLVACKKRVPFNCKNGGYDDGWHCVCPPGTGSGLCETVYRNNMIGVWDFFNWDLANPDSPLFYRVVIMEDTPSQDRIIIDNLNNSHQRLRAIAKKDSFIVSPQLFLGKVLQGRASLEFASRFVYMSGRLFCSLADTTSPDTVKRAIAFRRYP